MLCNLAMHRSYLPKNYIHGRFQPVQLHLLQGMFQSPNERQGDMKLKALVGHITRVWRMAGRCTGQGSRNAKCQQAVDGLRGSMCVQFSATYLRSLKHRMVYNTFQICSK